MKKCHNCGTEFEGKFCPECGALWREEKVCPSCGAHLGIGVKFCTECGYAFMPEPAPVPAPAPEPAPVPAPVPVRSLSETLRGNAIFSKVLQYLPAGLLLFFSLLIWAFYAAPVYSANILIGNVEGNLYQLNAETALRGAVITCYLFASLSVAAAFVALYASYRGSVKLPLLLSAIFYLFFFSMGIALIVIVGDHQMSAGACPILMLVFSCIFALLTAADFWLLRRQRVPSAPVKSAPAEKDAAPREMEKLSAPQPVQKPKKPSLFRRDILESEGVDRSNLIRPIERHIQNKRILACMMWLPNLLGGLSTYVLAEIDTRIGVILVVAFGLSLIVPPVMCRARHIKGWHPEKVYRRGGTIATLIFALALFLVTLAEFVSGIPSLLYPRGDSLLSYIPFGIAVTMYVIIGLLALLDLLIFIFGIDAVNKGKALSRQLCGFTDPAKNEVLFARFTEEQDAYLALRDAYRQYRREVTVYNYTAQKKDKIKRDSAPYVWKWLVTHKLATGAMALCLAAVIVVACVLGTMDYRFTVRRAQRVFAQREWGVTDVLGDPDETQGNVWYFYSGNMRSLREKMQDLSEKMENAASFDELAELTERYDALQKEAAEEEYKVLRLTFADGQVQNVMLDTAAKVKTEKKEVEKITVTPDPFHPDFSVMVYNIIYDNDHIRYEIEYTDGSYQSGYFSSYMLSQIDFGKSGNYPISWSDEYGEYKTTVHLI